eukprot:3012680-Pyramimonas_sp.AAC.1
MQYRPGSSGSMGCRPWRRANEGGALGPNSSCGTRYNCLLMVLGRTRASQEGLAMEEVTPDDATRFERELYKACQATGASLS